MKNLKLFVAFVTAALVLASCGPTIVVQPAPPPVATPTNPTPNPVTPKPLPLTGVFKVSESGILEDGRKLIDLLAPDVRIANVKCQTIQYVLQGGLKDVTGWDMAERAVSGLTMQFTDNVTGQTKTQPVGGLALYVKVLSRDKACFGFQQVRWLIRNDPMWYNLKPDELDAVKNNANPFTNSLTGQSFEKSSNLTWQQITIGQ